MRLALAGKMAQWARKERLWVESRVPLCEGREEEPKEGNARRGGFNAMMYGKSCYLPSI